MADVKGGIKIPLTIDTKAAEKSFDTLADTIKETTKDISKDAGSKLRKSYNDVADSAKEITKEMSAVGDKMYAQAAALDKISAKNDELISKIDTYKNRYDKATENIYEQLVKVQALRDKLSSYQPVLGKDGGFKSLEQLREELRLTKAESDNFEKEMIELQSEARKLKLTPEQLESAVEYRKAYNEIQAKIQETQDKLEKAQNAEIIDTSQIDHLRVELAKLEKQSAQTAKSYGEVSSHVYDKNAYRLINDLAEGERKGENFAKTIREIKTQIAAVKANPELAEEAAKVADNLALAEQRLKRYKEERGMLLSEAEQSLTAESEQLAQSYSDAESHGEDLEKVLEDTVQQQQHSVDYAERLRSVFNALKNGAKKIADSFRNVYSRIKKMRHETDLTNNTINQLYKRLVGLVKRVFVFSVITRLLNALRKQLSTLFNADPQITEYFSKIKANLMTAFAPIYEYVLPLFKQLLEGVVVATQYLAQVISRLFGKTVKESQDAAKALIAQARATDKTSKATDKLNKSLGHLDELNNDISTINEDSSTDDLLSGFLFDDDFNLSELNYREMGESLGEAITNALNSIPWDRVKSASRQTGTNIAEFLNGLISPALAESVGYSAAQFINTKQSFINGFLKDFKFENLGQSVVNGAKTFLENLDWDTIRENARLGFSGLATMLNKIVSDKTLFEDIGKTFANMLLTVIDGWWSFVSTFKFEDFGKNVGNAINAFLDKMNETTYGVINGEAGNYSGWQYLGASLTNTAAGILEFLLAALTSVDWAKVGKAIGELINSIDWGRLALDLGMVAMAILDALGQAIIGLGKENPIAAAIVTAILLGATPIGAAILSVIGSAIGGTAAVGGTAAAVGGAAAGGGLIGAIGTGLVGALGVGAAAIGGGMIGKGLGEIVSYAFGDNESYEAYRDFSWGNFMESILNPDDWAHFWNGITEESTEAVGKVEENIQGAITRTKEHITGETTEAIKGFNGMPSEIANKMQEGTNQGIQEVIKGFNGMPSEIANKLQEGTLITDAGAALGKDAGNAISENLVEGVNQAFEALNNAQYTSTAGISVRLGKIPLMKVPHLATGMVVPAGSREFLSVLGDNKQETEVVSPLSTMRQAMLEALEAYGGGGQEQTISLQIDGNELFRWLVQKNKETYLQTHQNMLIY